MYYRISPTVATLYLATVRGSALVNTIKILYSYKNRRPTYGVHAGSLAERSVNSDPGISLCRIMCPILRDALIMVIALLPGRAVLIIATPTVRAILTSHKNEVYGCIDQDPYVQLPTVSHHRGPGFGPILSLEDKRTDGPQYSHVSASSR